MEKLLKIKTPDHKIIYGKLRGSLSKPVIIIVHGLMSNTFEALYYNAQRYFEKNGFTSFLPSLYDWRKGARKLKECTLKIHGQDIDTIVKYLKSKGAEQIFIVGHSYGAPSILHSTDKGFKAIAFWDGTLDLTGKYKNWLSKLKYVKELDGRVIDENFEMIVPEKMVEESKRIRINDLVLKNKLPLKIICAGDGILAKPAKKLIGKIKATKEFAIIKGASHNFEEDGVQERLFEETARWFIKW